MTDLVCVVAEKKIEAAVVRAAGAAHRGRVLDTSTPLAEKPACTAHP